MTTISNVFARAGERAAWDEEMNKTFPAAFVNTSGIEPRGRAVLIAPYEPELKTGLIQLPDQVAKRDQMVNQRAVVVALGPCAWDDEAEPRALPGDKVLVTAFAGYMAQGPSDGKQYRLVNDRDIFARIK